MTEIEKKALERVNEVWPRGLFDLHHPYVKALRRAIEQHEAFRQEVSDAAEHLCTYYGVPIVRDKLSRFILAKPDPLVDAITEAFKRCSGESEADSLRQALAKRGLEIREKE
jgi:hypothetical protein